MFSQGDLRRQTVAGGRSIAETSGKSSDRPPTLGGDQRFRAARLSPLRGEFNLFAAYPEVASSDLRPLSGKPPACRGGRDSTKCLNSDLSLLDLTDPTGFNPRFPEISPRRLRKYPGAWFTSATSRQPRHRGGAAPARPPAAQRHEPSNPLSRVRPTPLGRRFGRPMPGLHHHSHPPRCQSEPPAPAPQTQIQLSPDHQQPAART